VNAHLSRLPRLAAFLLLAGAAALGVLLAGLNLWDQWRRLARYRHHGLGFADPACTTGYCDHAMFWLAGVLARHGQAALLYHPQAYAAAAARLLPYPTGWWPFVYPPPALLLASIISALPLVAGYYVVALLLTLASLFLLRGAGIPRWCIALGLLSPAALWNLYLGQFGLLCGALLLYGLTWLERQPVRAGVLLALLSLKPQYALLAPVFVLAGRHWRTLLAGCGGLLALVLLSLAYSGVPVWAAYLGPGRAAMAALLNQNFGGFQHMGISVFWMLRSLHAPLGLADAGQGAMSAAAALICTRLWSRPTADAPRRRTLTILLTLLASPYGFTDDLAIYTVLLPTLARRRTPWRNAALAWLWVAPALMPRCAAALGFLPTPLLLMAAAALAWQSAGWPAAHRPAPARPVAAARRSPAE
jgi:hypothetical protein